VAKTFPKKRFGDFFSEKKKKKRTLQMNEPLTFWHHVGKIWHQTKTKKRFEKQTHHNKEEQIQRTFDQNHMR
jgi:hypothetical protein